MLSEGMCLFLAVFVVSVPTMVAGTTNPHMGQIVAPFQGLLQFYNISEEDFGLTQLKRTVSDFVDRLQCDQDGNVPGSGCQRPMCLPITQEVLGINTTTISDNVFNQIAISLVVMATKIKTTCGISATLNSSLMTSHEEEMVFLLGFDDMENNTLYKLQDMLESLSLEDEVHEEETEEHAHDEHELIEENCLGSDVLYDMFGLDVDDSKSRPNLGHLATLILLAVVKGAHVSRECRLLPRESFFSGDVFRRFHAENGVMSKSEFTELLEVLEIGELHGAATEAMDDGHGHKRRRRSASDSADGLLYHAEWNTTCYEGDQLLAIYGVQDSGLTLDNFIDLCPSLIQQIVSKACVAKPEVVATLHNPPTTAQRYGYGTIATVIVCLCSTAGVIFLRCCSSRLYRIVIELFLGLAVGTLVSDSLLHLVPQALGIHSEDAHAGKPNGPIVVEEFVWYSLVILAGLYAFYLLEKVFSMSGRQHNHSHGNDYSEHLNVCNDKFGHENNAYEHEAVQNGTVKAASLDNIVMAGKQKTPHSSPSKRIQPVVLMVLLGDALHNFADGMAIGASFSADMYLGLSTTIAVFFHELPHELGDTAILLNSGMSLKKAVLLNLLSALTAMVGLYVGLAVSADETVQRWIISAGAGMFLYIALVDMLPQLIHVNGQTFGMFLINNIGILFGVLSMVLLAVFESRIQF